MARVMVVVAGLTVLPYSHQFLFPDRLLNTYTANTTTAVERVEHNHLHSHIDFIHTHDHINNHRHNLSQPDSADQAGQWIPLETEKPNQLTSQPVAKTNRTEADNEVETVGAFTKQLLYNFPSGVHYPGAVARYCRGGADWCSKPLRYPANQISRALARQSKVVASVFTGDKEPVVLARSGELPQHLAMENVCSTHTSYEMPKAARNKAGQFRFIVNGGEGLEQYTQLVRMERCSQAGAGCGGLAGMFASHRTECKQGFTDHKLVTLDPDGEELIVDTFSFPSCCSCYVDRSLEI